MSGTTHYPGRTTKTNALLSCIYLWWRSVCVLLFLLRLDLGLHHRGLVAVDRAQGLANLHLGGGGDKTKKNAWLKAAFIATSLHAAVYTICNTRCTILSARRRGFASNARTHAYTSEFEKHDAESPITSNTFVVRTGAAPMEPAQACGNRVREATYEAECHRAAQQVGF